MSLKLDRRNNSLLGRWWWTVDRPALFAMMTLACMGIFMVAAASPPVAMRIGLPEFYFVKWHQIFLSISVAVLLLVSTLPVEQIKRIALIGLVISGLLMLALPVIGFENKGAIRWVRLAGISLQPSEIMKPCFAIITAWIFAHGIKNPGFAGYRIACGLYIIMAALLINQPDLGMTITVSGMFAVQFFLAGMPFAWVAIMAVMGVIGMVGAYQLLPHVAKRIDSFLNPSSDDNYQVQKSLQAFAHGRWFGTGPGEGTVKQTIPDSHTDFIFAVAGEEFGVVFCLFIISVFTFIVVRGFLRLWQETDNFNIIAVGGLLAQFGIQAVVNMGVAVNLLPAKGMTLPFLSSGGSSLVAMAFGMGMMLALTRKRYGTPLGYSLPPGQSKYVR